MRVIGIDPGLANTGYGVVERRKGRIVALDSGVIQTSSGEDEGARLATIFADLEAVLGEYRPAALAVENLYFGQNASSAFKVGQARGVVLLVAGRCQIPTASYTPQQIKQAVCGSGRAAKDQVIKMIKTQLNLPTGLLVDHAADALGVALCHINHLPMQAAIVKAKIK